MLTKKQFDVLVCLEENPGISTQREISEKTNISLGAINTILKELGKEGLINNYRITQAGLDALEPYRVKRAVFIAAGFGSRLVPITFNSPKPLVRVHGKRIIDSLLDAVIKKGIEEIYIVRGYLGEQFDQLLYKYPQVKFIENPDYNTANNISSIYYAREHLQNAYICEADLLLYNEDLIQKYQYSSNYLGVPVKETDDWCLYTKNGVITKVSIGGTNCNHMYGISYWDEKDGARLKEDVVSVFHMPGGRERYWDQVPLQDCLKHYSIRVRPCTFDDITEIDTLQDLMKIDPAYKIEN